LGFRFKSKDLSIQRNPKRNQITVWNQTETKSNRS